MAHRSARNDLSALPLGLTKILNTLQQRHCISSLFTSVLCKEFLGLESRMRRQSLMNAKEKLLQSK